MAWTLHLQPIENPWADAAMLAGGRAMCVAQAFEEKCRSLLRVGHIVAGIDSDPIAGLEDLVERVPKDKLLGPTLIDLASVWPDAAQHQAVLSSARGARNYIAHESMRFGIHSRWDSLLSECPNFAEWFACLRMETTWSRSGGFTSRNAISQRPRG